ncbi:hypothetical protein CPB86DRAFT_289751 [Serendipita vermifera]|nr:hypothetical protein CPB86DRAFT_289751 [Serendipita vermifera]
MNITTIRAVDKLPVELWEQVIDDALDDTLLLSTRPMDYSWYFENVMNSWICPMYDRIRVNPIEFSRLVNQPAIRQYQQTKVRLQLVCHYWKDYVNSSRINTLITQYFIPNHPSVAPSLKDMFSAKRIEAVHSANNPLEIEDPALLEGIKAEKQFSVEILVDIGGVMTNKILRHHHYLFLRLTALHLDLAIFPSESTKHLNLEEILPNLVSLTCLSMRVDNEFIFPTNQMLLPNLTTLNLIFHRRSKETSIETWNLPSLLHLQISGIDCARPGPLADTLRSIASQNQQLRTLSLKPWTHTHEKTACQCLKKIWSRFPSVTRLQLPITSILHHEVPNEHPLVHVVNSGFTPLCYSYLHTREESATKLYAELTTFCLSAHQLCTITDSHEWEDYIKRAMYPAELSPPTSNDKAKKEHAYQEAAQTTIILAQKLQVLGVRYEDRNNRTLNEVAASCKDGTMEKNRSKVLCTAGMPHLKPFSSRRARTVGPLLWCSCLRSQGHQPSIQVHELGKTPSGICTWT